MFWYILARACSSDDSSAATPPAACACEAGMAGVVGAEAPQFAQHASHPFFEGLSWGEDSEPLVSSFSVSNSVSSSSWMVGSGIEPRHEARVDFRRGARPRVRTEPERRQSGGVRLPPLKSEASDDWMRVMNSSYGPFSSRGVARGAPQGVSGGVLA